MKKIIIFIILSISIFAAKSPNWQNDFFPATEKEWKQNYYHKDEEGTTEFYGEMLMYENGNIDDADIFNAKYTVTKSEASPTGGVEYLVMFNLYGESFTDSKYTDIEYVDLSWGKHTIERINNYYGSGDFVPFSKDLIDVIIAHNSVSFTISENQLKYMVEQSKETKCDPTVTFTDIHGTEINLVFSNFRYIRPKLLTLVKYVGV